MGEPSSLIKTRHALVIWCVSFGVENNEEIFLVSFLKTWRKDLKDGESLSFTKGHWPHFILSHFVDLSPSKGLGPNGPDGTRNLLETHLIKFESPFQRWCDPLGFN